MIYRFLTFLGIFLLICGCNHSNSNDDSIYIGGQIQNPETDYIVLSRSNKSFDTLYLNRRNQFGKRYDTLSEGIYAFKHMPESQIMYLEPGDSVLIYVNTIDFDNTLNFSGKGSEKSSFLLDMFLKNQKDNNLILKYYKIPPEDFAVITDSIKEKRIKDLEELSDRADFSEEFFEIARSTIDYEYYDLRERYSLLIHKYYKRLADDFPDSFFKYREDINFSDSKLEDYYVYTNLIDDYLKNKSIQRCTKDENDHPDCFNLNSFKNMARRMELIDSISTLRTLKNEFIDRLAQQSITKAENDNRIDSILQLLKRIEYSKYQEAVDLADMQKSYFKGSSLSEIKITNAQGELTSWGEVINKPTVNYAWSLYSPAHHRWQHKIIRDLRIKYPEIEFNGINLDMGEREEWLRTLETFDYDKASEYQISNRLNSKVSYKKYLNKVLLVNPDGTIAVGDTQFGTPEFEIELQKFIKEQKSHM
ncbi:hypothetical protein [Gramella sp. AN32]|uniref:Thioredoxin domain-containing protein n=1 Tax=Christiangramia antarctica TaxID=2058158 RepID=A0ABW5X850_9FLAO|nr:hypothetical protein [Gramella sp. AN32]